jgi:hypothetical protein
MGEWQQQKMLPYMPPPLGDPSSDSGKATTYQRLKQVSTWSHFHYVHFYLKKLHLLIPFTSHLLKYHYKSQEDIYEIAEESPQ